MKYHIPGINIFYIILTSLLILIIFVALIILAKKKLSNLSNTSLIFGCVTWFIAVYVESIFHQFLLPIFDSNIFSYAIYGGLMAGLFEETGRLICFYFKIKPSIYHKTNSLYYGIGHGGFEAFYLITINNFFIVIICYLINKGLLEEYEQKQSPTDFEKQLLDVMKNIYKTFGIEKSFFKICFFVVWERISAITYHISASVLVWYASSDFKRYFFLYLLAIGMHTIFDCLATIFAHYISNLFLDELFIFIMAIGSAYIGFKCWKYFENNIEVKQNLIEYENITLN